MAKEKEETAQRQAHPPLKAPRPKRRWETGLNGAFGGLVQRLVVPNETNARHDDATNLRETENTKNEAQVLAVSIAETAKEKEAAAQR